MFVVDGNLLNGLDNLKDKILVINFLNFVLCLI